MRDCADMYGTDMKFKELYQPHLEKDTWCIICRDTSSYLGCKGTYKNIVGDLEKDEMICFCKTDKCNQCEYKDEGECTKSEWNYGRGKSKLEVCYDLPCANRNLWKPINPTTFAYGNGEGKENDENQKAMGSDGSGRSASSLVLYAIPTLTFFLYSNNF